MVGVTMLPLMRHCLSQCAEPTWQSPNRFLSRFSSVAYDPELLRVSP